MLQAWLAGCEDSMVETQQLLASRQARHQRCERLHSSGSPLSKASFAPAMVEEAAGSWLARGGGGGGSGSDELLGSSSSGSGTYDEAAWAGRASEEGGGSRQRKQGGRRHSAGALPRPAAGLLEGAGQLPGTPAGQLLRRRPGALAEAPASDEASAGQARRAARRGSTGLVLPKLSPLEPVPEGEAQAQFPIYSTNRRLSICFALDHHNATLQGGKGSGS
jgi:hypothetical protein